MTDTNTVFVAQSLANPALVAQTVVQVTLTPTQPGITLLVQPDPLITVPFNGAEVPTGFRAVVHNSGPAADTFNLTVGNVPGGFTVLSSAASLTIPAGQTGVAGIVDWPQRVQKRA